MEDEICDGNATTIVLPTTDVIQACEKRIAHINEARQKIDGNYRKAVMDSHNRLAKWFGWLGVSEWDDSETHRQLLADESLGRILRYPTAIFDFQLEVVNEILYMARESPDGLITLCRNDYRRVFY